MAGNSRDVSLVIRAKNEASAGIKSVADALDLLSNAQGDVASGADRTDNKLDQLARGLAGLEAINKKIAASSEASAVAISRQAQSLVSTNGQITDRRARVEELNRALGFLAIEADKAFIGPKRNGLTDQIKFVKSELRSAQGDLSRVTSTFDHQLAGLQQSRAAFRDIQAAEREAHGAVTAFNAEIANQTRLMEENTVAVQRAKAAQAFFNNKAAPGLSSAGNSAVDRESIAAVLRVAEARDIEIQKLREEAAAVRVATDAQRNYNAILDKRSGKSAADSASVFSAQGLTAFEQAEASATETAAAMARMDIEADELRASLNPLAAVETKLANEQARLNAMFKAGKISAEEQAAGLRLLKGEAERASKAINGTQGLDSRGRPAMFGLKPYELQNLSFQINDVVTQIASGTSVTQTLAQQGGQILQLFPRVGSSIAAGLTSVPLIAFTATLGAVVLGINEAANQAERLRTFGGVLATNADGARYQAEALNQATNALDLYGMSADEALKIVRVFLNEGLDQSRIEAFGRTARDLADTMGIDLADAAKQVVDAFTGGFDAVDKLDQKTNFLTATQREHIRTLYEQGKAQEAGAEAYRIFAEMQEDGAQKMRGPWSSAVRELGSAWDEFTLTLSDLGAIQAMARALDQLGRGAAMVMRQIRGATSEADLLTQIAATKGTISSVEAGGGDPKQQKARLAGLEAELKLVRDQAGTQKASATGQAQAATAAAAATERRTKAEQNLNREITATTGASKGATDAERIRAAETEARGKAEKTVGEDRFAAASDVVKQEYIANQVSEAGRKIRKEIAEQSERAADAAERERKERQRGYAADIANNGRDGLIATAQRFNGFSENNPQQASALQDFFKSANMNVDPKMTAWCAAFVNAVLASNGLPGTGKLNAKSFLGYGQDASSNPQVGDIVILNRGNNAAEGHVGFFQGFDEKGNVKVLGGNQKGGTAVTTSTFNRKDVVGIRRAPSTGDVAKQDFQEQEQLQKKQETFNEALDNQIERRREDTEQLREQLGLQDEALLAKQREAAIEDAVLKAQQEADKAGITPDDVGLQKRLELLRQTTGAYFDASHAKEAFELQRNAVDKPVEDLTALRDTLRAQRDSLRDNGLDAEADALAPKLNEINGKLSEAIDKAIAFHKALSPGTAAFAGTREELDAIIARLETLKVTSGEWGTILGVGAQQITQALASTATAAIDRFTAALADGKNAFSAMKDAFLSFASDFLRQIGQMIIQQLIFNAAKAIMSSVGVPVPGMHTGGIAGSNSTFTRSVSPGWFTNATRYHTGGVAGLRPDEIPTILQKGEEVLTRGDPRHRFNGGGSGGGEPRINVINAIDAGDFVSKGMGTPAGEKAILNFIKANPLAVRQAMG